MARELLIVKKPIRSGDDPGVPEFGKEDASPRYPDQRRPRPDEVNRGALNGLRSRGVSRALYFGYGLGELPPVFFPAAEYFKDRPFEEEHWKRYGNMESEKSRIDFMLGEHWGERGFPDEFEDFATEALAGGLASWEANSPKVAIAARKIFDDLKKSMTNHKTLDMDSVFEGYRDPQYRRAYESDPQFYITGGEAVAQEKKLWNSSLYQLTHELQDRNYSHVGAFLDLYARIKDPITPVTATLPEQIEIFIDLFKQARRRLKQAGIRDVATREGEVLVAQLALESSFLALPNAKDIFYTRGDGLHHDLPYVYVDLKGLPRGEFTVPVNPEDPNIGVIPIMREILSKTEKYKKVMLTPITIAHFQTPGRTKPTTFIIDGNNRATALMVMQYLNSQRPSYEDRVNTEAIRRFMTRYDLHPGWEREIFLTLKQLPEDLFYRVVADRGKLRQLARVRVPALLVQEANFHTIAVDRSIKMKPSILLLQPMHQAIYNHDHGELAMAIPPKKQTHGRAPANDFSIEAIRGRRRFSPFRGERRYRPRVHDEQQESIKYETAAVA